MLLNSLQQQLERIYQVKIPHDVGDFVIHDETLARRLGSAAAAPPSCEQLFVHEGDDQLDISLYIEQSVVERLRDDDPWQRLHGGNISDYCTALEGVSHFVYLIWNARFGREVSALELELQAEVDKYISLSFLFGQQDRGVVPQWLGSMLFNDPEFDNRLDRQRLKRYQEANYYARKFCRTIENRYLKRPRGSGLFNELRRFYRLTRWQKIDHIAATHGARFRHFVFRH